MNPCKEHVESFVQLTQFSNMRLPIIFEVLSKHGREMQPLHGQIANMGELGMCYRNAAERMDLDLLYCEGYALRRGLIPLMHAWLADDQHRAIDPTWDDGDFYFGVKFSSEFIYDMAERTGHYGVFDGLYMLRMSVEETIDYVVSGIVT